MTDSIWTEDRIAELTRLHAIGHTAAEIARALGGPSRSAVIGKLHRLNLQKGRPTRRAARAQSMAAKGQIAPHAPRPFQRSTIRVFSPQPRGFLDIADEGACRFPIHEDDAPFLYCANACPSHRSYCAGHHQIAYDREATKQAEQRHAERVRDWLVGQTPRPGRIQSTRLR